MALFGRTRALGFALLALTFLAGGFSGAALERVLSAGEPERARQAEEGDERDRRSYIIDRVEMAPEQRETIDAILEDRAERMRAIWREVEPRMDAITDSARADIMQVLTPDQRAEYERRLEERREARRDRDRREGHQERSDDASGSPTADSAGSDTAAESAGKDAASG